MRTKIFEEFTKISNTEFYQRDAVFARIVIEFKDTR